MPCATFRVTMLRPMWAKDRYTIGSDNQMLYVIYMIGILEIEFRPV